MKDDPLGAAAEGERLDDEDPASWARGPCEGSKLATSISSLTRKKGERNEMYLNLLGQVQLKSSRSCTITRGKGFFWSVDFSQEARAVEKIKLTF